MPAEQHFDQQHLQAVALAQSGQIRAAHGFSAAEKITRPLVWLIAIIAVVAIGLGIRDYVGEKRAASPAASTGTPTVAPAKGITHVKRTASSKTKVGRSSASGAGAAAAAQAARGGAETPLVNGEVSQPGAKLGAATDNGVTSPTAGTTSDELDAAVHGRNGIHDDIETIADPALSACLPLPNGVQPGDVDAPYYFGWASEYCGRDLTSQSHKSKK